MTLLDKVFFYVLNTNQDFKYFRELQNSLKVSIKRFNRILRQS